VNQTTGAAPGPACMDGIPRWASSPEAMQVEVMSSDTNSAQPSSSARPLRPHQLLRASRQRRPPAVVQAFSAAVLVFYDMKK